MDISAKDAGTNGFLGIIICRWYARNARALIGISREKGGKMDNLTDKPEKFRKTFEINELQILAQLIEAMNDAVIRLEEYYNKKDIENFNKSKEIVLGFQAQISGMIEK